MILIYRNETDPYFNIAAEEYVLKEMDEDVFMLWVNEPSVIIGKHQVAAAEADIIYTYEHNIPVIRRISGGGTVYHDKGNLNYSLISHGERGKLVDYERYSATVIRALAGKSIIARLQGKSNLVVGDKKFSGNAEHVYKNRVLHHGTLLFNTDLGSLRKCIRPEHRDYVDTAIRSNDSTITNLIDHLPGNFSIDDFKEMLIQQIKADFPEIRTYQFSDHDYKMIQELAISKYKTFEWNFSYSPKYELNKAIRLKESNIQLSMKTEKGRIKEIKFSKNGDSVMENVAEAFVGVLHHPADFGAIMDSVNFEDLDDEQSRKEFLNTLF